MKRKILGTAIVLLSLMVGCYFPETSETRIIFNDKADPIVIIKYHNISSGAENADEMQESFDELMKDMYGEKYLVDRAVEGLAIRKRNLYIENGQLHAEIVGDARKLENLYILFTGKDERFMIYDGDDSYELVETNGKIVRTDKNTLIVWPEKMKEIYWKERLIDFDTDEDSKLFFQNVPKMIAMFEDYKKKNKIE